MKKRSSFEITKAVTFALVLREMRGRLNARRLGTFWILFEPVCHIGGLLALYTLIRGRTIPGFEVPVFLLVGIVPFLLMKNICLKLMEAVSSNRALFSYRQIKPFDTLISRAVVEICLSACVYTLLIGILWFFFEYDVRIAHPIQWALIMLVGIVLSFSIGVVLCVIRETIPELKGVFTMFFLPLYLISGVIYPVFRMPPMVLDWILWNPYLHIIDSLRWAIFPFYPKTAGINMEYPTIVAICLLFSALALYRARRLQLVAV